MRKTVTTIRCVPRYGYGHAQVRAVDLELYDAADEKRAAQRARALVRPARHRRTPSLTSRWTTTGFFAVINDDAYLDSWGEAIF